MASQARRTSRRPRPSGPWKHGSIPVIGLVGGIGSGKSAVAERLGALGAFVIDADHVGHALLAQRPVLDEVARRFGPGVLTSVDEEAGAPAIDRGALGAIVFANADHRKALEAILHPRMRATFQKAIARTIRRGVARAVVLDAAILFEAGWADLCDRVLFVDAPREARLARVVANRGWTEAQLDARERAQLPLDQKADRADAVIANHEDLAHLDAAVSRAWDAVRTNVPRRPRPTGPTPRPDAEPPRPFSRPRNKDRGR